MELSGSEIKKFLYFLKRKLFLYFWKCNPALFSKTSKNKKNLPRENLFYSRKCSRKKAFLIFRKTPKSKTPKKIIYISGNGIL